MGCFSDIDIRIDTAADGGPSDYEVTFRVTELKRATGNINTMVGNQEGSLMTGLALPNFLGRGERFQVRPLLVHILYWKHIASNNKLNVLQVDYSHGTRRTSTFNASLTKPLLDSARTALGVCAFQQMAEFPPSGFKEVNRGALFDVSFVSGPHMQHNVAYEGCWRDIRPISRSSAFAVREHSGHTLKSAVKHVLTCDRRDNPVFPSVGSLLRMSQVRGSILQFYSLDQHSFTSQFFQ